MRIIYTLASVAVIAGICITVPALASGEGTESVPCSEASVTNTVSPAHWQRYSWTGGPHESDDAPAFPSDDWQPNVQGDPHGIGEPGAYFRSHGNSGKGDWFYLEWVEAEVEVVPNPNYPCENSTSTPTDSSGTTEPTDDGTNSESPSVPTDSPSVPECMNDTDGCNESVCQLQPELCDNDEPKTPVKDKPQRKTADALPDTGA